MRRITGIINRFLDLIRRKRGTVSSSSSYVVGSSSSTSSGAQGLASSPSTMTPPLTSSPPKTPLESFFDDAISMYVLPDIERLTNEIRPDNRGLKKGLRGCTIPLAMMLFAVIDLFGFLMREDQDARKTDTRGNFEYLLSDSGYFPSIYRNNCERILKLYRHGVMHQIFPKASAIAKAGVDRPLMDSENGTLVLNVDRLSRDVVTAINQIEEDVRQGHDTQLIARMNDRLEQLTKEDYRAAAEL